MITESNDICFKCGDKMNNKQPARPQSIELSLPSIKLHAYRQICLK